MKVCRVQACVDLDVQTLLSPDIVSRDDRIRGLEQALRVVNLQKAEFDSS